MPPISGEGLRHTAIKYFPSDYDGQDVDGINGECKTDKLVAGDVELM